MSAAQAASSAAEAASQAAAAVVPIATGAADETTGMAKLANNILFYNSAHDNNKRIEDNKDGNKRIERIEKMEDNERKTEEK
eukprot:12545021-Ditylum_brightwellii.AAC.1